MASILCSCPQVLCLNRHNPEDGTRGFAAKIEKPQGLGKPKCQKEGRQMSMLDPRLEAQHILASCIHPPFILHSSLIHHAFIPIHPPPGGMSAGGMSES